MNISAIDVIFPDPNYCSTQRIKQESPIEHPRKVAASFAIAVTARVAVGSGWIARNGEFSLFRTLQRILPRVRAAYFSNVDQVEQIKVTRGMYVHR